MDRIINVKVSGNYLVKYGNVAGVRGEANVTKLRIIFDESWDYYAKKVTFLDARGLNPVNVILGVNMLEDIAGRAYLVPIPVEPLNIEGKLTFIIEGSLDNKIQKSFSDKLEVKEAPDTSDAINTVDPTPSELAQMQAEIEYVKDSIIAVNETENAREEAETARETAESAREEAETARETAESAREEAEVLREQEHEARCAFWADKSAVYIGSGEMPEGVAIQIDPTGEATDFETALDSIIAIQEALIGGDSE